MYVEIVLIWEGGEVDLDRIRIRKLSGRRERKRDRRRQEMITLVRTNKKLLRFPAPVSIITNYLLCM